MIQKKTDPFALCGDSYSIDSIENDCFGEDWPYSEVAEFFSVTTSLAAPAELELPPATSGRVPAEVPVVRIVEEFRPKYELCVLEPQVVELKKAHSRIYKTIRSMLLAFIVGIIASLLIAQNAANRMVQALDKDFNTRPQIQLRENIVANLDGETLAKKLGTHTLDSPLGAMLLKEASKRKDERLSKVLAALTDSSSRRTRVAALRALSSPFHLAQDASIRAILDRMQWDKDLLVRGYAAKILARSGNEDAITLLRQQLKRERSSLIAAILIRELEKAKLTLDSRSPVQ